MTDKSESNEFMSYEEALISQVFTLDALVNVLERKGLISRQEIIKEIKEIEEQAAKNSQ